MDNNFFSSRDGDRLTVNDYMKSPTRVPNLVLQMAKGQFIVDDILRKGPSAASGAVVFRDPVPIYSDGDAEIVAEYAEIPGVEQGRGGLHSLHTTKNGLAVKISQTMRDRNDVGVLEDDMRRVMNTLRRSWDRRGMNAITTNSDVHSIVASNTGSGAVGDGNGWYGSGTTDGIRKDIANAMYQIMSSYSGSDEDQKFGYEPDTLIVNNETVAQFLDNDEVNRVFAGGVIADENLRYTGVMPRKFFSLNVMKSWQVPSGMAIVLQRNMVGFISDERPLTATPLYEDRPRETWRSDVTRQSVIGIDNPKAACLITNIDNSA